MASPSRATSAASEASPVTATGRVWGTSASSAPSVTTSCVPSASATSTISRVKPRQRNDGSLPVEQHQVARRARHAGLEDLDRGPLDLARCALDELDRGPRGLEVVELLGVDRREALGAERAADEASARAEAASPASFQPLNAHTSAGARRPSGRCSHCNGCIRFTVHHGLIESAHTADPGSTVPSAVSALRPGDEVERRVRVHAQGPPDRPHRHAVSGARAARPHGHDPGAGVPRRRRARRPVRARRSRARARARVERFRDELRARGASRSRAPSRREADPAAFLPVAYRDLDELDGFLEHLAREVHDPRLPRAARRAARRRAAARGAGAAPPARAPATTPTSAACSSTRSRWRRSPTSSCQLHPRLNCDLLLTAAIVHDLGRTREFTYGAEIGLTEEGRLLGHVALGLRMLERARRRRWTSERRLALATACSATTAPTRRPVGGSARPRRSRCTA